MVALDYAAPGRATDLVVAVAACDVALGQRPADSTAPAWASLKMTRSMLDLRLTSIQRRPEIRHHPGPKAERPASLRFS